MPDKPGKSSALSPLILQFDQNPINKKLCLNQQYIIIHNETLKLVVRYSFIALKGGIPPTTD